METQCCVLLTYVGRLSVTKIELNAPQQKVVRKDSRVASEQCRESFLFVGFALNGSGYLFYRYRTRSQSPTTREDERKTDHHSARPERRPRGWCNWRRVGEKLDLHTLIETDFPTCVRFRLLILSSELSVHRIWSPRMIRTEREYTNFDKPSAR